MPSLIDLLSPEVRARSGTKRFGAGDVIVREGEPGSSAFILLSGACDVIVHGEALNAVRPGELFGDVAFVEGGTRTATVRAAAESEVLELANDDLRAELQRSPALLDQFLRGLAQRVRSISRRETTARDEHRDLRRVLESLQPPLDPFNEHRHLSVDACWRPLTFASGDYYDVLEVSPGRFLFALGDVMGHGAPTAPIVSMIRSQLHEAVKPDSRSDELLAHLHRHMRRHGDPTIFMTLTLLFLSLESSTVEVAVAGPPAPLLCRAGACRALTEEIGWTLGYPFDGIVFSREVVPLVPGDTLLFYTDGLSEAVCGPDPDTDTLGVERLAAMFAEVCATPRTAIADALLARVDGFCGGWPAHDDRTALVVGLRESSR